MQKINTIELVEAVFTELRKHRSGGYFSDVKINLLIKSAEQALFYYLRDHFEETQHIIEHLQPFIVNERVLLSSSTGIVTFPDDYAYRAAVGGVLLENPVSGSTTATIKVFPCYYLDAGEFIAIQSDKIASPSRKKGRFYHTLSKEGLELLPKELLYVKLSYIKYPVYGTVKYTLTTGEDVDTVEYDESGSTNMEWNQITFPIFFNMLLEYFGVSIKDQYVMQYKDLPKIR